jgi:hypothetical protein
MKVRWVSEPYAGGFLCPQRGLGSLSYQSALLFRQGSVQVKHERIGIPAEFGHDERHPLSHEAGNKGNVPGKPIQLGDDYAAFRSLGSCQGSGQLGSPVERVGSFAAFEFNELRNDGQTLGGRKLPDCRALGFNSETRALLLLS